MIVQVICRDARQISCSRLTDSHRLLFLHKKKPILCDFVCSFILRQQNFKIVKLITKIRRKWSCNYSVRQISCSRLTDSHRLFFLHKKKPILCDFLCSFILRQRNVSWAAKIRRKLLTINRLTDSHRLLFLHKKKPILCDFVCSFILWQRNFKIIKLSAEIRRKWSCNLSTGYAAQ